MLILILRTDKPTAELYLCKNTKQLTSLSWQAHRELAETIHLKVKEVLEEQGKELKDIDGIVVFKGPGSFTGLRIGHSVANSLADSLAVPIVSVAGEAWQQKGIKRLQVGDNEKVALPDYGAPPKKTVQKK